MPLGLGARRGGAPAPAASTGPGSAWSPWAGSPRSSSSPSLRDVGLLAAGGARRRAAGALAVASLVELSAARRRDRRRGGHALGLRQRAPHRPRPSCRRARAGLAPALDGFTIAQISDVHVGPTIKRPYVEAIVATVNRLDADLVAITGDLVDGSVAQLAEHVAPLAGLRSKEGTFFVTGNHEYYSGAAAWVRELRRLGLVVLMNEHVVVRRGDAALVVAGVTDFGAGPFRPRPGERSAPRRSPAARPARCGSCSRTSRAAPTPPRPPASTCSCRGHTHGGQFWPWNLFVRLQQPFTAGLHRWRRLWVYTSRGTGYWGPPKRFGAPSEVTLLRLVAAAGAASRARRRQRRLPASRVAEAAPGV